MDVILLAIDGAILGLCLRDYFKLRNTTNALKQAKEYHIDEKLRNHVAHQPDHKIGYAIVCGTVRPIDAGIESVMARSPVIGVIQKIELSENRMARGFLGFWSEQRKVIHESAKEVPFTISNGKTHIKVCDGLSADVLDLDTIYNSYEPTTMSIFDYLFGFLYGVRQRGIQTTEEMLRDGSCVTAIGEIHADGDSLRLQAGSRCPMILSTSATQNSLIKRFEEAQTSSFTKCCFFGTIAAIFAGNLFRRRSNFQEN